MGTGTLTDRASGQTILDSFFNDIHSALNGDFVGRSAGGAATSGQNLGTNAIPWGTGYMTNLVLNGASVDTSQLTAPKNRIVSGATRSSSNQPQFITPNGAAASFTLDGASTNLVLDIDGSTVTVSTDVTKSSLTVGPSTTATCLVNESTAADQEATKTWGEAGSDKETIQVDTMGAEFSAEVGQFKVIKIAGVATEYALAFVKSSTELTDIFRGYFTDSSGNPVNRTAFTNNDTITVLSTGWVFVENDGATVDVSYTTPIKSFTSPSSPSTGDYWYDQGNQTWKRYDGATWQIINRTLVGVVGIDSSNCVCARSFDFFASFKNTNTVKLAKNSTSVMEIRNNNAKINVMGTDYDFSFNHETWNITTDLAGSADMYNATEQSSTIYYLYIKDTGETVISDISPYRRFDLLGDYHPHNPWRCVGYVSNDGSSDFDYFVSFNNGGGDIGKVFAYPSETVPEKHLACDGSSVKRSDFPELFNAIGTAYGTADSDHFNLPDCRGRVPRGWSNGSGTDPDAGSRTANATGGQTGDNVGSIQADMYASHTHTVTLYTGSTGAVGGGQIWVGYQTVATGASGGNETRGKNINFQFVIRYED